MNLLERCVGVVYMMLRICNKLISKKFKFDNLELDRYVQKVLVILKVQWICIEIIE